MESLDAVKAKFQKLQSIVNKLNEEKVGYEAQLSTLNSQYNEQLESLLKEVNAKDFDEAVAICKKKKEELEELKTSLQESLDGYLNTFNKEEVKSQEHASLEDLLS